MFSDTLCFRTPPIFHLYNYFLDAQKHVFRTPFVFEHHYFSWKKNFFSVQKHRVITVYANFRNHMQVSENSSVNTGVIDDRPLQTYE